MTARVIGTVPVTVAAKPPAAKRAVIVVWAETPAAQSSTASTSAHAIVFVGAIPTRASWSAEWT
jgi:hypothetical protein